MYVPRTRRERRSSSPPVHRCALLVTPVSCPLLFFRSFFCENRQPQQTMSSRSAVQCVNGMQSPNIRSRCGSDHIPRSGSTVHSEAGFIQLPFVWEEWIIVRELCLQGNT